MKTFKDFLVWYNNLDVVPFIQALERQSAIYQGKGIDMLKDAISLPGLAIRWMFVDAPQPALNTRSSECCDDMGALRRALRATQPVCLIDDANRDLYMPFK